jgi:7,8-dihydro-6-hydroxymethylpterin-pyrophosphokinase
MGDRRAYLSLGVDLVVDGDPYRLSSLYETSPWAAWSRTTLNLVLELETDASPRELLEQRVAEAAAQRVRLERWARAPRR